MCHHSHHWFCTSSDHAGWNFSLLHILYGIRMLINVARSYGLSQWRISANSPKAGSSLLTMAIAGGAVMPWVRGVVQDATSFQTSYWICVPCFLFILYYGMIGYKSEQRNNPFFTLKTNCRQNQKQIYHDRLQPPLTKGRLFFCTLKNIILPLHKLSIWQSTQKNN